MLNTEQVLAILHNHSFETKVVDGKVLALEVFTLDGQPGSEWVAVPTNRSKLYWWLGY